MSVVGAIREMLARGVPLEDALTIAEAFETALEPAEPDSKARRKARNSARKPTPFSDRR